MFYFGYLFWEWPTSFLLQRFPLAKYSAFNVIMWGLTLCCLAAVKDFAGAMVSPPPPPSPSFSSPLVGGMGRGEKNPGAISVCEVDMATPSVMLLVAWLLTPRVLDGEVLPRSVRGRCVARFRALHFPVV